jgi:sulfur-oxidizing protein SoxZ
MARKMKIRAWDNGKSTSIKAIIFHPMETGLRKDKKTGKKIPGHYITEVECEHNGKKILTCLWGPGVSKNPFLSFNFKGAKKGDSVKISWVDNQGSKGGSSAKIS